MHSVIKNHLGETIDYAYLQGDGRFSDWIVLLGHGVTGNRNRPVIAESFQAVNEAGFSALAFSFSGNGASEGAFEDSCVSKGVEDLEAVIGAVGDKRIAYIGHSMGAAIGVLAVARGKRIQRLMSLAGMVDTRKFALAEFGEEIPGEGCMWDDKDCPLSPAFMEDLCQTIGTVIEQTDLVKGPWLLLHGSADDVVSPQDSIDVKERLGDQVELVLIEGADHSFNGEHRQAQLDAMVNWLKATCD